MIDNRFRGSAKRAVPSIKGTCTYLVLCLMLSTTVFDLLAFKNDITFWRQNKSMEGLSARSVLINFFCQVTT